MEEGGQGEGLPGEDRVDSVRSSGRCYDRSVHDQPLVSVLLPVRDAEETLGACLESLADQSFREWECLAVDDHSTDRSREILDSWAARDRRILVVDPPEPGGIVGALEAARLCARGTILARQDADDRSLPSRLAMQVEALGGDPTLAVAGCLTRTPGALSDGMLRYLEWMARCIDPPTCAREIWIESPIAHPTAMMRASALEEVGGYRDLGWPEDYDLWFRFHRAGWGIANLPHVLYEWTDHPGRLSRRDPRYAPEAFLRCRMHHLRRWFAERGIARPMVVWGAGRDGRRLARAWEVERGLAPIADVWEGERAMVGAGETRESDERAVVPAGETREGDGTPVPAGETWEGDGTPVPAGEIREGDDRAPVPAGKTRADDEAHVEAGTSQAPEIAAFVDIDPRKIGRHRRGRPILDPESARRAFPGAFYLAAVGVPGARELIRATFREWGMTEGADFLCVH